MEPTSVTIDWGVAIALLASGLGPAATGFLQQFSKEWIAKAPWYLKSVISSAVSAIIGMIATTAASGDAMLGLTTGAVLGGIGSVNIAFRKGTRGNLQASLVEKQDGQGS